MVHNNAMTGPENQENCRQYEVKRDERGRFVKGYSGNPKGRPPKNDDFVKIIDSLLDEVRQVKNPDTGEIESVALRDVFWRRFVSRMLAGDWRYIKEYIIRKWGRAPIEIIAGVDIEQRTKTIDIEWIIVQIEKENKELAKQILKAYLAKEYQERIPGGENEKQLLGNNQESENQPVGSFGEKS